MSAGPSPTPPHRPALDHPLSTSHAPEFPNSSQLAPGFRRQTPSSFSRKKTKRLFSGSHSLPTHTCIFFPLPSLLMKGCLQRGLWLLLLLSSLSLLQPNSGTLPPGLPLASWWPAPVCRQSLSCQTSGRHQHLLITPSIPPHILSSLASETPLPAFPSPWPFKPPHCWVLSFCRMFTASPLGSCPSTSDPVDGTHPSCPSQTPGSHPEIPTLFTPHTRHRGPWIAPSRCLSPPLPFPRSHPLTLDTCHVPWTTAVTSQLVSFQYILHVAITVIFRNPHLSLSLLC